MMIPFADASAEQAIGWVSQLGSAGLAALAVWWLTGKHEKAIASMTANHAAAFATISESYGKLAGIVEKRSDLYQELERQRIAIMTQIAAALAACERRLDTLTSAMQANGHLDADAKK